MIDVAVSALTDALATPGLPWLLIAGVIAGTMYGFAGFGAALLYLPVATVFLTPREAVAAFMLTSLVSLTVIVPKAWPQADRRTVAMMIGVALVFSLGGLWVLDNGDVTALRWLILAVVAITLAALVTGWRRTGAATPTTRASVAAATGFVGGATGLAGPIFILFQLSSTDGAARHRANIACFLTLTSVALIPIMSMRGMLGPVDAARGILLVPSYAIGNLLGQWLFDPSRETLYRRVAYVMIGVSILVGLPIFD